MRALEFDLDAPLYAHFEVRELRKINEARPLRKNEVSAARRAFDVIHRYEELATAATRARLEPDRLSFTRERFVRLLVRRAQRGGGPG